MKPRFSFFLILIILTIVVSSCTLPIRGISSASKIPESDLNVTSGKGLNDPGFGVEIARLNVDFSKIQAMGAKWIRYNAVIWSDIESEEGKYNWNQLSQLEDAVKRANDAGLKIILIVRSTPAWAQKVAGSLCGPIAAEKLQSFGNFMSALVKRFSESPMKVDYWELWNEPDVDVSLVPGDSVFGCWGDKQDPYYGGGYYAEMLKIATPAIHSANPDAKVFLGGLLLDCDPTDPGTPGRCKQGYDLAPKFFEGILQAGGGKFMDYVSFHGYPGFNPKAANPVPSELNMISWQARGGVVMGKANYLREVMAKYNINLPLFLTETSFLCDERNPACNPPGQDFYQKQAEYGAWLLVRNYAEGIGTIWYTYDGPGWRSSGILDQDQNPKPVYASLQFIANLLQGSKLTKTIEGETGVTFEFSTPKGIFYFQNPFAGPPTIITVEGNTVQNLDIFGNKISQ